jgi:hypothetical protein
MKSILVVVLFAYLAFCAEDAQESESVLDIDFQVEPDNSDDYYNVIKNFFLGYSEENAGYPLYKQCDSRWKNDKMGTKTICQVGCLMSSVSMAISHNGRKIDGSSSTPKSLNAWLKKHGGYSGNLFVWGSVKSLGLCYVNKAPKPQNPKTPKISGHIEDK